MLSIGQFAKLAKVSTRTIRYYESIGLLPASRRGENNYRYYDPQWLQRLDRIRNLQSLGFRLDEVQTIIQFSQDELNNRLQEQLTRLADEIDELEARQDRIRQLLSVSTKIEQGESLTTTERELYMESIKQEVLQGLRARYSSVDESVLTYLDRDEWIRKDSGARNFIEAVQSCIQFARRKKLTLGPARGSAPSSLSLFGLGISGVDPLKHSMIPERLSTQTPFFHVDVEYDKGQEFVDYCREINRSLGYGEIQAFKMPLIDIVQNTHKAIFQVIDYDAIEDDSDVVLNPFRNLDLEKIFQFDFSEDALVMNYERFKPEFIGLRKITEHFQDQKVFSFRDITNITALWRPHCQQIIDRIDLYKQAKAKPFSYGFLSEKIEQWLKPNSGVVIYHEDLIKIISEYTGWDFGRSNALRRIFVNPELGANKDSNPDWIEFQRIVPKQIVDFVAEESKWAFCLPHAISFAKFTKQTAVLKSLHKEAYYAEIERFEQKHGFRWDDIGIRMKGVSLHQG